MLGFAPISSGPIGDAPTVVASSITYARAPSGQGYTPMRSESQSRPIQGGTVRPAATQTDYR